MMVVDSVVSTGIVQRCSCASTNAPKLTVSALGFIVGILSECTILYCSRNMVSSSAVVNHKVFLCVLLVTPVFVIPAVIALLFYSWMLQHQYFSMVENQEASHQHHLLLSTGSEDDENKDHGEYRNILLDDVQYYVIGYSVGLLAVMALAR